MKLSVLTSVLGTALSLPGRIGAAEETKEARGALPPPAESVAEVREQAQQHEVIKRFDANGDGKLDEEERMTARAVMRQEGMQPRKAGDGPLRAKLLERFDRNKDGKLDEAERADVEKAAREKGLPPGALREAALKQFDRDDDGKLNDAERAAAQKEIENRRELRKEKASNAEEKAGRMTPAERERLQAVAAEIRRRRLLRDATHGATD